MSKHFVVISALLLCGAIAHASPLPDYPFVTASGHAEVWLAPDIGEIQFEVNAQDQQSQTAARFVEEMSTQLCATFTELGIAASDIEAFDLKKKSLELSIHAEATSPLSYVITRHFQLRVRDLAQWPALIAALVDRNNIDSIAVAFDRTDRAQVTARLTTQAAKDARAYGTGLADAFGRRLGPVVAISKGALDKVGVPFGLAPGARETGAPAPALDTASFAVPTALQFAQAVNAVFRLR